MSALDDLPTSSTLLNVENDPKFYEKYFLNYMLNSFITCNYSLNIKQFKYRAEWYKESNITPRLSEYKNILCNFIKLYSLINEGSYIKKNKMGLYDFYIPPGDLHIPPGNEHTQIIINLYHNGDDYIIKVFSYIILKKRLPGVSLFKINSKYPDAAAIYTKEVVEQILGCYNVNQFINTSKNTRLIPDILRIVYSYAIA